MAFIIVFVLLSLAIMLSGEIYKKGRDNAILHSWEDGKAFLVRKGFARAASQFTLSVKGAIKAVFAFIGLMVVVAIAVKILFFILSALISWMLS
jgi:hypothetical protein